MLELSSARADRVARCHALGRVAHLAGSRRPFAWFFAALGVAIGLPPGIVFVRWFTPPISTDRDFATIYLLTRALAEGVDIGTPLTSLARHYGLSTENFAYPFPTPHPPTTGLLLLPFAALDYQTASIVWFAVGLGLLTIAVFLSLSLGEVSQPRIAVPILSCSLLAWLPVFSELIQGQVMILMLVLVLATLLFEQRGRPIVAGVFLGFALLVKPVLWPLAGLLLIRRYWRMLGSASLVCGVGYLVVALVVGPRQLFDYFTRTLPTVLLFYRGDLANANLSVAAIPWRLVSAANAAGHPLPVTAGMASALSGILPLVVLGIGLWWTRGLPLTFAAAVLICVSVVVSPVTWTHYLVLLLGPAALATRLLARQGWPPARTNLCLAVSLALAFPSPDWSGLSTALLQVHPASVALGELVVLAACALYFLPTFAIVVGAGLIAAMAKDR